jgi:hypothetical protein
VRPFVFGATAQPRLPTEKPSTEGFLLYGTNSLNCDLFNNLPTSFFHQASLLAAVFVYITAIRPQAILAAFHSIPLEAADRRDLVTDALSTRPADSSAICCELKGMPDARSVSVIHRFPYLVAYDCTQDRAEDNRDPAIAILTDAGADRSAHGATEDGAYGFPVAFSGNDAVITIPLGS